MRKEDFLEILKTSVRKLKPDYNRAFQQDMDLQQTSVVTKWLKDIKIKINTDVNPKENS